jgi:hypothetical protein
MNSAHIASFIYRWRRLLTGIILVGAGALAPRADFTKIDNDITAWFSKEDPVYRTYERLRDEFGGTRTLIIALEVSPAAPDAAAGVFTADRLRFIDEISADIERVPTVQRVHSLGTATMVRAMPGEDGGLKVEPLLEPVRLTASAEGYGGPPKHLRSRKPDATRRPGGVGLKPDATGRPGGVRLQPDVLHEIRRRALDDDLIRGDLVSEDGSVAAIIVSFDEERIDAVRGQILEQIRELVDLRLPRGVRAHYNGSIEISETYNRVTLQNQRTFIPPIFVLTFGAIYVMFRSVRRTALTMFAVFVSIVWTLGLYSLMGFTYNVLSSMIVPLIVVLAIADDVHIMQHFEHERRRAGPKEAFERTVTHLFAPLLGASGTTALGMLSLATSQVVAVRDFGIGSAVGIMVDFVLSIVLVPVMLTWVEPERGVAPHEAWLMSPMRRIARLSSARPRAVVAVSAVILVGAAAGIPRLYVDTNHINFFAKTHPLSTSADVIDHRLAGIYSFQILLEGPPESLKSPDALRRMKQLEDALHRLPFVKKVTSVADYVERINRELHDGDPAQAVVPDDPNLVAQELFLFSMSDDGRRELERIVSSDFSRAQVSVKLASMSSDLVFEQIARADGLAREVFAGSGISTVATGAGRLFSTLDHYLVVSQMSSFVTAFATVFGVIFLIFRSARFGLLAMVPNLFPVVAVLGLMGWAGISLNVATIMVASVALGVVDDDTIHFINRFRRETGAGASADEAIEIATTFEGRAALTTAFINSCAYAVITLSEYKPNAWFGGLLALTMAVAFLAEVFVLPATIKLAPRWFMPRQVAHGFSRAERRA